MIQHVCFKKRWCQVMFVSCPRHPHPLTIPRSVPVPNRGKHVGQTDPFDESPLRPWRRRCWVGFIPGTLMDVYDFWCQPLAHFPNIWHPFRVAKTILTNQKKNKHHQQRNGVGVILNHKTTKKTTNEVITTITITHHPTVGFWLPLANSPSSNGLGVPSCVRSQTAIPWWSTEPAMTTTGWMFLKTHP